MMFIGGASGSTAGGVKINTLGIMLIAIICVIRGREETIIFKRRIPNRKVLKAFSIVFLALILVFMVTFLIHILQPGTSLINTFFDSVSALGTVGLSTGVIKNLTSFNKILIILCMFTGRIGPISFALALTPGRKHADHTIYPDGKFVVG
jgi:trk system potassium uptake protein TrkH